MFTNLRASKVFLIFCSNTEGRDKHACINSSRHK